MAVDPALFREIESAVAVSSQRRRDEMVRRVTDLFIVGADGFSDDEINFFDDVLGRLIADIEVTARAMLAERLTPIANAPRGTMRKLALDGNIDVAGPVLARADCLDDPVLVEAATHQGQDHLFAISLRRALSEPITDVLVERGDQQVVLNTVENRGARFSSAGFAKLVERSQGDDRLAARVGSRADIPPDIFFKLLAAASEAVRQKLEAIYPQAKGEVQRVVAHVAGRIAAKAQVQALNYETARQAVAALKEVGALDDGKIGAFARAGRLEETTAALALLCDLPIAFVEAALMQKGAEIVLVLATASGLSWPTLKAILLLCTGRHFTAGSEIAHVLAKFERLKPSTAKQMLRFYRSRAHTSAPSPV